MKRFTFMFLFYSLIVSCDENSSQTTAAVEDLKERVTVLEKELQLVKNKADSIHLVKEETQRSSSYFVIGSTMDEVLEVMGDPTTYIDFGTSGKRFDYGLSTVFFENGKVTNYNNVEGNLKVRVR